MSSSLLVGFHLFLAMASHLLMGLDMARDAQRLQVVATNIVGQILHLLLSLGRLDGCLVVHIDSSTHEAFTLAPLAQRVLLKVRSSE